MATLQTMYPGQVNSPVTELAGAITTAATSFTVLDGNALPAAPNIATIGQGDTAETVVYGVKTGNTISSVVRGFNGTIATSWASGVKVARNFTAYDYDTLRTNIAAVNTETGEATSGLAAHVGTGGNAHALATTSAAGFLSASDKSKLDGMSTEDIADAFDMAEEAQGMAQRALGEMLPTNTNLGTVVNPGKYDVQSPVDGPPGLSPTSWIYLEVFKHTAHATNFVKQIAYSFERNSQWVRTRWNGTWSAWEDIGGGETVKKYGYSSYMGKPLSAGPVRIMPNGTIDTLPLGEFATGAARRYDAGTWGSVSSNAGVLGNEELVGTGNRNLIVYQDTAGGVFATIVTEGSYDAIAVSRTHIGSGATSAMGPSNTGFAPSKLLYKLTNTTYLLVWMESVTTVKAVVLTVGSSGTSITAGTAQTVTAAAVSNSYREMRVCSLSTTNAKLLISFATSAGSTAVAISASGTAITVGSSILIIALTQNTAGREIAFCATDKAVITYSTGSANNAIAAITASGLTLTLGTYTPTALSSTQQQYASLICVNGNAGLLIASAGNGFLYYAFTISGSTITMGNNNSMGNQIYGNAARASLFALSTGSTSYIAIVAYTPNANSTRGASLQIVSLTSGGTATPGSQQELIIGGSAVPATGASAPVMVYHNVGTNRLYFVMGVQSTFGPSNTWAPGIFHCVVQWSPATTTFSRSAVSRSSFLAPYEQSLIREALWLSGSGKLLLFAGDYSVGNPFMLVFDMAEINTRGYDNLLGSYESSTGAVVLKGTASGWSFNSGVSTGSKIYVDAAGVIQTTPTNNTYLGLAVSPTELYMPEYLFK